MGLASDAPCPECGMLDVHSGERFEGFKAAWAHSTLGPARFATWCGAISFTGALLSILCIIPLALIRNSFGSRFDEFMLIGLQIWLYVVLPSAGFGMFIGIISCFCREWRLASYAMSMCLIAAILPPLLVIGGAAMYNNFW